MIKFKEKTREELIAGFKRAIERKKEFEEQAQKEFADMRKRGAELKSALWNRLIFLPLISMRHIPFGNVADYYYFRTKHGALSTR